MIKGITVTLNIKEQTGTDALNQPIFKVTTEDVSNVLVGEPTADEIANTMALYGKEVRYTLAIPKGDTHTWVDTEVTLPEPFAGTYKTIGYPTAGIDANIPLSWNKKVKIERYG